LNEVGELNEEVWERGEGVGENGKKWYFCLSVGKSGEEWVVVGRSGLGSLNQEKNRALHLYM